MNQIKTIDGHLNAADLKFAILATRFNDFIVDRLVGGAVDYLIRHGGSEENLTIVRVPGAFEMPLACKKLALPASMTASSPSVPSSGAGRSF